MRSLSPNQSFEIRCERSPRRAELEDDTYYFYVRIFLAETAVGRGDFSLDEVSTVIYELDPSFGDSRFQKSSTRRNDFEILIWTYGWFIIKATVILKNGRAYDLRGKVEFPVSDQEKAKNGREQFTW